MHIKSIVIDGFKSYGRRTEIRGFDPEFNAITGLNGTGKSNILDSICFVLGISNLGQVRATSLQELVYKSGQAGITKATVTLIFDNSDKSQSPISYEKCSEISVTRQIVVGGKNKYFINGKTVINKKVQDLFCSVQLNVNNPNFLIMQGRITKVLNMKPHEILSMIEEAAGTSMYEAKRESSLKILEKKDAKLNELNKLIDEEAKPRLEKLRAEHHHYLEYQKVCRDVEYLTRLYISHTYLKLIDGVKNSETTIATITRAIEQNREKIQNNVSEVKKIDEELVSLQKVLDEESGGALTEMDEELTKANKIEATITAKRNNAKELVVAEERTKKQLDKSIKEDEAALAKKEAEMQRVGGMFEALKKAEETDSKAYEDAQKRVEAISEGKLLNEQGEAASLQDQLMTARQQITESNVRIKQREMELKQNQKVLNERRRESQTNDAAYTKEKQTVERATAEIARLEQQIGRIQYEEGTIEGLQERQAQLTDECRRLNNELRHRGAHRYELQYRDPEPNFDRRRVRGMLGKLLTVRDKKNCLALGIAAGGSLYSYVTDKDETSKKILQHGQLQTRTTMIPLNKISSRAIEPNVVRIAQELVGRDNVASALSLIDYDAELEPAMRFAFGRTLICKNMDIARRVTFDSRIRCRSVTLEGDVVDPEGTLSGGSAPKGAPILLELSKIKELEAEIAQLEAEQQSVTNQIRSVQAVATQFTQVKEQLERRRYELEGANKALASTTFQRNQEELEELREKIETAKQEIEECKQTHADASRRVKDIESKLKDSKGHQERELKKAEEELKRAQKQREQSSKSWAKRKQEYETLQLEIEDLKKGIETAKQQIEKTTEDIERLKEEFANYEKEVAEASEKASELKARIKEQKDRISSQNKEIRSKAAKREKLLKQNTDLDLDIKKQENEITKVRNENKHGYDKINEFEKKYPWIPEEKEYFGVKNTRYDYTKENPVEAGKRLKKLNEQKDQMSRNINQKAMMLLEREEQLYENVTKKKKIVEADKTKILKNIAKLDEQRKGELRVAWDQVNENFGGIFSSILPGTQAKLIPADGKDFLKGLEVKIGFNGLWKETLTELSGGQRSLVALSLILAMLKYKPAPLYILDEVDAALDLSHTQNIGNMLKNHFTNSQFVIVSLKDGMFNNANVLFRTRFVDGMSDVVRTENPNLRRK